MRGTISVESTPQVGSCFKVTLPFSGLQNELAVNESAQKPSNICSGISLRILLAEDNEINITVAMSLLKKLGHDVVLVKNGKDCLLALEQYKFDLVLMDIQMPIMNGEEALRKIRNKEQGTDHHQLVIALTAHAMHSEEQRFLEVGFDGYISKPLVIEELVNKMERVLNVNADESPGVNIRHVVPS